MLQTQLAACLHISLRSGSSTSDDMSSQVDMNTLESEAPMDAEAVTNEASLENAENELPTTVKDETLKDDEKLKTPKSGAIEGDAYSYTTRGEYTSELFKVEIKNLPSHVNYAIIKKLFLVVLKIVPQKMKIIGNPPKYAFVSLKSEADKQLTLEKMNGYVYKKNKLVVISARPTADPYVMAKRKSDGATESRGGKKTKNDEMSNMTSEERDAMVNEKTAPLWKVPYDEQIEKKTVIVREFLVELLKEIGKMVDWKKKSEAKESEDEEDSTSPHKKTGLLFAWNLEARRNNERMACPLEAVKRSPLHHGYRNKCEFSIGPDKTVGFRIGAYKQGSVAVASTNNCPIVSKTMNDVTELFEDYVKNVTTLPPFDSVAREGYWKQLTVRTNRNGDILVVAIMLPQKLTQEDIDLEKEKLKKHFLGQDKVPVSSLYFQLHVNKTQDNKEGAPLELLSSSPSILEVINLKDRQLEFEISPTAFFQVNTLAAEICYQTVSDLVESDSETIVLDICCGTGTIGLCVASKVKKVIGVELNAEAVEDAKKNALRNKVDNIEFVSGSAESVVPGLVAKLIKEHGAKVSVIAIVDPPRAGLHASVIKCLRAVSGLKKLIYVSCEPRLAKSNLADLSRPQSKAFKGEPFVPIVAVPIDMFPNTTACEVVFVYERLSNVDVKTSLAEVVNPDDLENKK